MKNIVDAICLVISSIILIMVIYQILSGKSFEDWLIEQLLPFFAYLLAFSFDNPDGFIILSILVEKAIDKTDCEELNKFMTDINEWFWKT